jgi:hypothetical protein
VLTRPEDLASYGVSVRRLADLSIIQIYERQRALNPQARIYIWSLDKHLKGYDRKP